MQSGWFADCEGVWLFFWRRKVIWINNSVLWGVKKIGLPVLDSSWCGWPILDTKCPCWSVRSLWMGAWSSRWLQIPKRPHPGSDRSVSQEMFGLGFIIVWVWHRLFFFFFSFFIPFGYLLWGFHLLFYINRVWVFDSIFVVNTIWVCILCKNICT